MTIFATPKRPPGHGYAGNTLLIQYLIWSLAAPVLVMENTNILETFLGHTYKHANHKKGGRGIKTTEKSASFSGHFETKVYHWHRYNTSQSKQKLRQQGHGCCKYRRCSALRSISQPDQTAAFLLLT